MLVIPFLGLTLIHFSIVRTELDTWLQVCTAEGFDAASAEISTKMNSTLTLMQHIAQERKGHGVFSVEATYGDGADADDATASAAASGASSLSGKAAGVSFGRGKSDERSTWSA